MSGRHWLLCHSLWSLSKYFSFLFPRPRNGSQREPRMVADAGKSSSCKAVHNLNLNLRAAVSSGIISPSVCVRLAGFDNVLCKTFCWTDLVVLGFRKCSVTSLPCCHLPEHCSCAGLVFCLLDFFFFLLVLNWNKCIYACWLYHIPLLKTICTLFIFKKMFFYLPMWSRKCLWTSQINPFIKIVCTLVNKTLIQKRTFIFGSWSSHTSKLLKLTINKPQKSTHNWHIKINCRL